jgi:hypothetical protein
MGRPFDQVSSFKKSGGCRRLALTLLAFVYLFVGIAHNISCLDHAVASSMALQYTADASDEGGSKSKVVMCDHCPTCAPAVMPAPSVSSFPTAVPAAPVVAAASVMIAGLFRLDTPPPKFLT